MFNSFKDIADFAMKHITDDVCMFEFRWSADSLSKHCDVHKSVADHASLSDYYGLRALANNAHITIPMPNVFQGSTVTSPPMIEYGQ